MSCCYTKFLYDLPSGSPLRRLVEATIRGTPDQDLWERIIENPEIAKVCLEFSTPEEITDAYEGWIKVFNASGGNARFLLSVAQFGALLKGEGSYNKPS